MSITGVRSIRSCWRSTSGRLVSISTGHRIQAGFAPAARRLAGVAAKTAISLAAVWLILRRMDVGDVWSSLAAASPSGLLLAFAAFLLIPLMGGLRWWMALRGIGSLARAGELLLFFSVACVIGQVLPMLVGDGVRVLLATRQGYLLRPATQSVLLERVSMLLTLLVLCCATAPAFVSRNGQPGYTALAGGLLACGLAGCAALLVADRAPPFMTRLRHWEVLSSAAAAARCLVTSLWGAGLAACSLLSNLNFTLCAFLLARALGIPVTFWDMLLVMPAVILAATLPVSFGGWGVREGALVLLLGRCGVPAGQALALSLLFGGFSLLCGLPGLVVWACGARRTAQTPAAGPARLKLR